MGPKSNDAAVMDAEILIKKGEYKKHKHNMVIHTHTINLLTLCSTIYICIYISPEKRTTATLPIVLTCREPGIRCCYFNGSGIIAFEEV